MMYLQAIVKNNDPAFNCYKYSAQINSSESPVFIYREEFHLIISSIFSMNSVCVYQSVFTAARVLDDNAGLTLWAPTDAWLHIYL